MKPRGFLKRIITPNETRSPGPVERLRLGSLKAEHLLRLFQSKLFIASFVGDCRMFKLGRSAEFLLEKTY